MAEYQGQPLVIESGERMAEKGRLRVCPAEFADLAELAGELLAATPP